MWNKRAWIPLWGSISLAVVAAAGTQDAGPLPGGSMVQDGPRIAVGEAPETTEGARVQEPAGAEVYFDPEAKSAVRRNTAPVDRSYLTDVGPRLILPDREELNELPRTLAEYYVQFERALSAAERREYVLSGVRFYTAMGGHTYLARLDRRAHALLLADPLHRGIEPVLPVDKLTRGLWQGRVHDEAMRADGTMEVFVRFYEDVELDHALAVLERWDVLVVDRQSWSVAERLTAIVTHGQALVLAEEPAVRSLHETFGKPKDDNIIAASLSNVDDIQAAPFNLTGAGIRVGQWELRNPLDTHQDFGGRVSIEQSHGTSDHATHVAGTIIGDGTGDATALGMAPGADRLYSYTSRGDHAREMGRAVHEHGIRAANHSWGMTTGWEDEEDTGHHHWFGRYDFSAHLWDGVVKLTNLMIQKSSGNDGNDCDSTGANCDGQLGDDGIRYHTISEMGNAKNILTVGATDGTATLTDFSSTGPTDDNRIKPDLVAKGDWTWSTWAGAVTEPGCPGANYCHLGGTSMATPVVTGTVMLLLEQYRNLFGGATPSADLLKAVLINTAEDQGRYGPDYAYGHGLLDALAAAETIELATSRIIADSVSNGDVDVHYLEVPAGMPRLSVTGVWVDVPGRPSNDDPDLVHDLDLRLIGSDGTEHFPFSGPTTGHTDPATNTERNSRDNVEVVWAENPAGGIWTAEMRGTRIPIGPQAYTLVANTSFFTEDEPNIEISANLVFDEHCPGDVPAEKKVQIFNTGGAPLFVHTAEVTSGAPDFALAELPTPPFVILPGAHVELTALFDPQSDGLKVGNLQITSNDPEEPVVDLPMEGLGGVALMDLIYEGLGFGVVPLGESLTHEFRVTNDGTCPFDVTAFDRTGGSEDFDLVGTYDLPVTIFPGEQMVFFIRYKPTDYGADVAYFQVSGTGSPFGIAFSCNGECLPPVIDISGSLDFGAACGGDLLEKQLDICNNGVSDLEVTWVAFDSGCNDFTIVNNPFPATLVAGACLPLTVRYTPTSLGDHQCDLAIESNDPEEPIVVLPATGTLESPNITISGSLDFGEACAGAQAERIIDVCNTGPCDLEVSSVEFNPPCGDFTIVGNPFPAVISHDFCLPVTIRYTPTGAGEHECLLEIHSNDPDSPLVQLLVTGSTPGIALDVPPDVAFPPTVIQDVAACGTERPFPVTNAGDCPVTITGFEIVQGGMDYSVAQLPVLPVTLQPGEVLGEDDLALVFAPYAVTRHSDAEVRVTYVTNEPALGDTETVARRLCGEGTRTGVRVLVTENDVPVPVVKYLDFYRVNNPGTSGETLSIITLEVNMGLLSVPPDPPCEGFEYHREWGALDDPRILEPGTYRVVAKIINQHGLLVHKKIQFELSYCDFWHDAKIDF